MSDVVRATATVRLPADAVTVKLTNDGPFIWSTDAEVELDEHSHWELAIEGLIETEEIMFDDEDPFDVEPGRANAPVILRGALIPTSIQLHAIG